MNEPGAGTSLLTVGHGTMERQELADLLAGSGVELVVDVRSVPASRRHRTSPATSSTSGFPPPASTTAGSVVSAASAAPGGTPRT
ncbi:MAG: hypothetical protein ACRD0L_14430 [Acidimicrobiales bacterium]